MNRRPMSRRVFLTGLALAAAPALADPSAADEVVAPKETGLPSEGLLAGHPGFQPRTVAPLGFSELPGFLSAARLATHHAEYAKAVEDLKTTEKAIASASRDASNAEAYGALRRRQVAIANDVLLHELYFANLSSKTIDVPAYVRRHVREHMGSLESWKADFKACALAARAWAALVYDPYDDRWHNTVMDGDNDGVWIGANPLVVCDVAPHAYEADSRREEYVTRFIDHIDWAEVAQRYHRVDRM